MNGTMIPNCANGFMLSTNADTYKSGTLVTTPKNPMMIIKIPMAFDTILILYP